MPIFQYRGYNRDGSQAIGTLEADGLQDAISSIKERGIYPKEVRESLQAGQRRVLRLFRRPDTALLPHVTRQLATLLSSGVPLMEALRSLSDENGGFWKGLLVSVRDQVAGGSSLSRAMEGHKDIFPDFYVHMVGAGEQSGALDKVLVGLADYLEKQSAIKAKIRMAMVYPTFLMCVGFVVMSFLFVFVIPKIVKIFEDTKAALPLITIILIKISHLFLNYWWAILILLAAITLGVKRLQERNRRFLDGLKLKIPGSLIRNLYIARFARILGLLLNGGLPMLRALEFSAKSLGNVVLEERIIEVAKKVAEGGRLSASLEGFPPVLLQLISTGERSGKLEQVLSKAADSYEEEFGRKIQEALSLLEPLMILMMAGVVGFIVLAVLLPIFQLNQLVK